MARTSHRLTGLAVVAAVLLILGSVAAFWSVAWQAEARYSAGITVPEEVSWTLWIPQPDAPMAVIVEGSADIRGSVSSAYALLNVTGFGPARLLFTSSAVGFGDPFQSGPRVNLTGRSGSGPSGGYRVWRASADPAANVTVFGGTSWSAWNLDGQWNCGGQGFLGSLSEGWNSLPVGIGDCTALITLFPGLIPAILLTPGAILAAREFRRRRQDPTA